MFSSWPCRAWHSSVRANNRARLLGQRGGSGFACVGLSAPGTGHSAIGHRLRRGVLGALQRYADPGSVHVLLSHLHADHCLDLPGLFVWRRYHPTRPLGKALLYGPGDTWSRLGAASSPYGGEIDDCSDIFDVRHWVDGEPVTIGELTVTPRVVAHPTESYGLRITDSSGASFVYSGDTGVCDQLVELARGADVFSARRLGRIRRTGRPRCICRGPRPAGPRPRPAFTNCC